MATYGRSTNRIVKDLLFQEGFRFDFFQAVRLLQRLYRSRRPVGGKAKPEEEIIRFKSHISLSFPASSIYEVTEKKQDDQPTEMMVAFMGLAGTSGVLPTHYTEIILDRQFVGDPTLREFLDIFNHRMISFFYRAWQKYRFPVVFEQGGVDPFTDHLYDLIGLGTKGLRGRLQFQDKRLLFYAGLLSQRPRSASAVESILENFFGVSVRVLQFCGQWLTLEEENLTRLKTAGQNNVLGDNLVVGKRIWDRQGKFRLKLGPLEFKEFCDFLPVGSAFRPLVQLTSFVVGEELDFDMELILKPGTVPCCRLMKAGNAENRLGWSTWLRTPGLPNKGTEVILQVRSPAA